MDDAATPAGGFRTFSILWVTQSISVFGSGIAFFAMTIWLTQTLYPLPEQRPQLSAALAAVGLASALTMVFTVPLAGAWADRYDRKRIMLVTGMASGVCSCIAGALMATGTMTLHAAVLVVAVFAFLGACHGAAFDTAYAMLVPKPMLPRANGMMQTMWALAGILSPAAAAAILAIPALARQAAWGGRVPAYLASLQDAAPLAFAVDALTFFLAAGILPLLFIPSPVRSDLKADGKPKQSLVADIKEGAVYIWRRPPLLWLLATFAIVNLSMAPSGVLRPLYVKFSLATDFAARGYTFETALAALNSIGAVGGVAGGVLISLWGGLRSRRVLGVLLPMAVGGAMQVGMGLTRFLFWAIGFSVVQNALLPITNAHSQSIWQAQVPRELQGRVFAVRRLIAQGSMPLGTAVAGWMGGRFDPGYALAVLGGVVAVFSALQVFNPHLLHVEDKEWLDRIATQGTSTTA
ncbi:MAG: MFS transporter [Bacillota bacterium]